MTIWTATRQDLYTRLPASACVPEARAVDGYVAASNAFDLPGHGYEDGVSLITFGGASLDSAINPIAEYTVQVINSRFFRCVGLTLAGDGSGDLYVYENIDARIDRVLADRTSYLIASAIAYKGPWTLPPKWAPGVVADLSASIVARMLRIPSTRYDVEAINKAADAAEAICALLRTGAILSDGTGPIDATDTPDDSAKAGNDIAQPAYAGALSTAWVTGAM